MKKYYLVILIFLVISCMALTSSAYIADKWPASRGYASAGNTHEQEANQVALTQKQVTLTIYALDGGINGPSLPGVVVTGQDAAGERFEGVTDSNGAVVIKGLPGTWQFTFAKEGYKTFSGNYEVTKTHSAATYLQRADKSQETTTQSTTQSREQVTSSQGQAAQSQEQATQPKEPVSLKIYVHEGNLNGTLLSDVRVTGQDATGNSFEGITDSSGTIIIGGQPGTWQFAFAKEGYDTLNLNYTVTETNEGAVYLQKTAQPQVQIIQPKEQSTQPQVQVTQPQEQVTQSQEPVALTVHAHEGSLNGTLLSDVRVTGQDATGNGFEGITDSNGAAVIKGQPGAWQFTFAKEGYDTLNLNYTVNETEDGAVYLQRAT